jgi:hypothetical protein
MPKIVFTIFRRPGRPPKINNFRAKKFEKMQKIIENSYNIHNTKTLNTQFTNSPQHKI